MKKFIVVFLLAFLCFECTDSSVFFEDALCIENISTIDPTEGIKEHQTLIIKDGKILRIAASKDLKLSKKNTIVDGTGKYLMPGLWVAHVHFSYLETLAPSMFDLFLAYGITSVRDTGGRLEFVKRWKDLSLANPTDAPRVMIAGPLLDGMPNVYDGSDVGHPPLSVGLPTLEDVSKQVSMMDSAGVDFLKAYEMLTPEQFAVITKYAKEKNFKVSGHVPLSMDVISASNGGLNSMEHLRNLEFSCATNSEELLAQRLQLLSDGKNDPGGKLRSSIHQAQRQIAIENYDDAKADEILKVFAKNQTWQIPTLALYTVFVSKPFKQDQWQKSFTYLPDSISKVWNASIEKIMTDEVPAFNRQYSEWMAAMVGKINRAGIGIMAGTDTPIGYLTPGLSLHEELELLVSSGLTPLEAIETATLNPAKYFNLENEVGSIKETMWADLLILDGNPLEKIGNTKRINSVIKQGKLHDRDKLDQVLEQLTQH